jgi:uncharacterized low-complexity protein
MKKSMKKSLSVAMGATFLAAMSATPVANADTNPFGIQALKSGYMHVAQNDDEDEGKAKAKEAKCGEGKCGEGKMKKEGKCGEGKAKAKEGKCGEGKAKEEEKEGGAE